VVGLKVVNIILILLQLPMSSASNNKLFFFSSSSTPPFANALPRFSLEASSTAHRPQEGYPPRSDGLVRDGPGGRFFSEASRPDPESARARQRRQGFPRPGRSIGTLFMLEPFCAQMFRRRACFFFTTSASNRFPSFFCKVSLFQVSLKSRSS